MVPFLSALVDAKPVIRKEKEIKNADNRLNTKEVYEGKHFLLLS